MEIKLASSNINQTPLKWKKNYSNIKKSINEAKKNSIDILCFPELSITGYGCQDLFYNEWLNKKSDNLLIEISKLCKNITILIGHPLIYNDKLYNSICIIKNTKILGFFIKSNLPNDGIHYEKRWFVPWKLGSIEEVKFNNQKVPIGTIQIEYNEKLTLGFEICRDSWDEEIRPANLIKTKKNLLILNPIASHYAFNKFEFRLNQVIKSSKKFNCIYMSVNLLGNESGKTIFEGDTILAIKGKLVSVSERFSLEDYVMNSYSINLKTEIEALKYKSSNKFDEFIDAFNLALSDYLIKSKSKGFALSLSGGLDSSSLAILIYEMINRSINKIGIEKTIKRFKIDKKIINQNNSNIIKKLCSKLLYTAYQKTENSSFKTIESSKKISQFIGSNHYEWSIDEEVASIVKKISKRTKINYNWEDHDISLQNIQSRVRSPFIWFIANTNNLLLLTTSNRSESSVGYSTMDGDSSGSIAPLAGIDKFFLRELINYMKDKLGYKILSHVLSLEPSAELKPHKFNQKDENDLMPYDLLSKIEKMAILNKMSPKQIKNVLISQGDFDTQLILSGIKKFFNLFGKNQWKRERTAPSFHFDEYSVDPSSWLRMPILSGNFKEELDNL